MLGGGCIAGHTPEGLQGAEVVEAQQIKQLKLTLQPGQPPAEAGEQVQGPAIDRRAPELARR